MIKTTIAVMASLMLVACGKGEDPEITNPEGQKADNVVSTDVVSTDVDSDKIDSDRPVLVPRVPEPAAAPAAGLTLTYFTLAG